MLQLARRAVQLLIRQDLVHRRAVQVPVGQVAIGPTQDDVRAVVRELLDFGRTGRRRDRLLAKIIDIYEGVRVNPGSPSSLVFLCSRTATAAKLPTSHR